MLRCCAQCPRIYLPSPDSDQRNSNVITAISFHVYQHIACFTVNYRRPFNEKKQCQLFEDSIDSIVTTKHHKIKYIVIMDSSIVNFLQQLYIPSIHKLAFQFPHLHNIGTHHCGNTSQEAFKRCTVYQDVL